MDPTEIEVTFDRLRIDFVSAARLIGQTYWGHGHSEGDQLRAFTNSTCAAAFMEGRQVGFARAVTDYTFFARLCDIVVVPDWRGRGVGKRLVEAFLAAPDLARVELWSLNTRDAHALYERFGFQRSADGSEMRLERRV